MSKHEVKLLIDDEKRLWVVGPDGIEREITIFNGGGYYEALWLRTQEEQDESVRTREEQEKAWLEKHTQEPKTKQTKKFRWLW